MLKRVSIQNFKSLKDVTLDLQKVNLLIGPNNSGKTNFLKALEFMVSGNHDISVHENTVYKKNKKDNITVSISTDTDIEEGVLNTIHLMIYLPNGLIEGSTERSYKMYSGIQATKEHLSASEFGFLIGQVIIYKPDPNKLDKPGPVGQGANAVNADASNLIAFLDYILNEYRNTSFKQIEDDLRKCVPEFTEINLQNVKSTEDLIKQFGDKTFKRLGFTDGRQNIKYWADELSEGTLYFLALLCIINQPNPPKLLLLEEPEKGIHPRRIREVMDFIRRLVVEKDIQVIMTTHNPLLLDEFAESPESVFVFDKDKDGATFVKNLQRDVIEPANKKNIELDIPPVHYTDALGEYWTIGFLGGIPHEAV